MDFISLTPRFIVGTPSQTAFGFSRDAVEVVAIQDFMAKAVRQYCLFIPIINDGVN